MLWVLGLPQCRRSQKRKETATYSPMPSNKIVAPVQSWSQLPHFPSRNFLPFRVAREEKSPMSPNRSAVFFGSSSRFAMFSSNPCPLGVPDRVLRRRVVLGGAEGGRWGAADWSWAARGGGFRPGPEIGRKGGGRQLKNIVILLAGELWHRSKLVHRFPEQILRHRLGSVGHRCQISKKCIWHRWMRTLWKALNCSVECLKLNGKCRADENTAKMFCIVCRIQNQRQLMLCKFMGRNGAEMSNWEKNVCLQIGLFMMC
jgi:hypothetical protein